MREWERVKTYLERGPFGLDVEKIDDDELDRNPGSVDAVQLPFGTFPCAVEWDRVDVIVDHKRDLDEEIHDKQALGAELERQDLNCIGHKKTGPSEGVGDTVQPDEEDNGDTCA